MTAHFKGRRSASAPWWIAGTGAALLAMLSSGTIGYARDRDRGENRDQGYQDQDQQRRDREERNHNRFDDHDRQVTRDWYEQNRERPVFRGREHWGPDFESRLQVGVVVDRDMRRMMHPVPVDLLRRLPPAPRHYRYVIIGEHVCLIDPEFRVVDVIHLEQ